MPELPDIEVFTRNLDRIFAGKKLQRIIIVNGNKLPSTARAYSEALTGKTLKRIFRSGKEMRFEFSGGLLLGLHLMLTGDVVLLEGKNEKKSTIAEFYFNDGLAFTLNDRMGNAFITLNPVDKAGVDALSSELNYQYLKKALQRKRMIKPLLTDQNIIRGIGNSYSDEILWETGISPYSIASAIPDDKIRELVKVIRKILKREIINIDRYQQGRVNGEVKAFLKIHTKERAESPTGSPIIIDQKGLMKTYYTAEQILYK